MLNTIINYMVTQTLNWYELMKIVTVIGWGTYGIIKFTLWMMDYVSGVISNIKVERRIRRAIAAKKLEA